MFVERLTSKQIVEFLNTQKDYQNVTSVNFINAVNKGYYIGIILFTVNFSVEPRRAISRVITATDTDILYSKSEPWIKFLYSVFGEEYKTWYRNKLEDEFKRLFEDDSTHKNIL